MGQSTLGWDYFCPVWGVGADEIPAAFTKTLSRPCGSNSLSLNSSLKVGAAPLPLQEKDENTVSGTRAGEVGVRACDRQAGRCDLSCPRSLRLSQPRCPPGPGGVAAVHPHWGPGGSLESPGTSPPPPHSWRQEVDLVPRSEHRDARVSPGVTEYVCSLSKEEPTFCS